MSAEFAVNVAGYKVYNEYEFDLTGRYTEYSVGASSGLYQYTILDKMSDGRLFNKAWFDAGAVITVYYETTGASAEPHLRLNALCDVADGLTADTYNLSEGRGGDQKSRRCPSRGDT